MSRRPAYYHSLSSPGVRYGGLARAVRSRGGLGLWCQLSLAPTYYCQLSLAPAYYCADEE